MWWRICRETVEIAMNLQSSLNPIQIVYQSVWNLRVHVSQSLLEFYSQNLFGVGYSIIWKVSSRFAVSLTLEEKKRDFVSCVRGIRQPLDIEGVWYLCNWAHSSSNESRVNPKDIIPRIYYSKAEEQKQGARWFPRGALRTHHLVLHPLQHSGHWLPSSRIVISFCPRYETPPGIERRISLIEYVRSDHKRSLCKKSGTGALRIFSMRTDRL